MAINDAVSIEWRGVDGSVWHVSGEQIEAEGVFLLPNPTKIYDRPVNTQWIKTRRSQIYQGFEVNRRDPILGFQIFSTDAGEWRNIDSEFRMSWSYEEDGQLVFIANGRERSLGLRLLNEPQAYESETTAGHDPHLMADAAVIINAAAQEPDYLGPDVVQEWVVGSASDSSTFTVQNDGDVEMWVWYTLSSVTADTVWTVADWSWGSDEYLRADADAARTWALPPLQAGEHVTLVSDPTQEMLISSLDTNPWNRCNGNGLLYPIPPHTPPTEIPISVTGATAGDAARLHVQPHFSRPFGVNRR